MLTCWLTNLPCAATSCRSSAISSRRLASPGSAGALCRATLPILCNPLVLWLKEAARATCLLPRWPTEACSARLTFTCQLKAQRACGPEACGNSQGPGQSRESPFTLSQQSAAVLPEESKGALIAALRLLCSCVVGRSRPPTRPIEPTACWSNLPLSGLLGRFCISQRSKKTQSLLLVS